MLMMFVVTTRESKEVGELREEFEAFLAAAGQTTWGGRYFFPCTTPLTTLADDHHTASENLDFGWCEGKCNPSLLRTDSVKRNLVLRPKPRNSKLLSPLLKQPRTIRLAAGENRLGKVDHEDGSIYTGGKSDDQHRLSMEIFAQRWFDRVVWASACLCLYSTRKQLDNSLPQPLFIFR